MGRFLIIGGIILIIVGFAGSMIGAFSGFSQFTTNIVNTTENVARFCNEGETLIEEGGATEYTPGQGYGRNVRYFCENAQGNRREVTGEFVQDIFGQVGNIFGGVSSGFPFIVVSMVGTLVLIVGVLIAISRRLNARPQMMSHGSPYGSPYSTTPYYPPAPPTDGQPMMGAAPPVQNTQQPYGVQPPPFQPQASVPQDTASKLRALEEARDAGYISITEYHQARQHILDEDRAGRS